LLDILDLIMEFEADTLSKSEA